MSRPASEAGRRPRDYFAGSVRLARRRLGITVTVDERTARDVRRIGDHPKSTFWVAACGLIFLVWQRCPTVISHAAFWAEDGWTWYPQCYSLGWRCLLIDHTGYLQTISRLIALLSLLWPLAAAPRVFALVALLMQAAPAIFLLSPRMAPAIPSTGVRAVLALLLVAIPGMDEVYVNLTNAQWHIVLLAFLILAAAPAVTWPQRSFDTLILLVCALSGPFAPMLLPVALLWCWRRPSRWQVWRLAIILVGAAVQLALLTLHRTSRGTNEAGVGWSLHRLINIVDTNIIGVAALGRVTIINRFWAVGEGWLSLDRTLPTLVGGCIMAAAVILVMISLLRGPWILRAFLIFAALEFGASLMDGVAVGRPIWVALEQGIGMRYYFHPIAAWLAVVMTLVCDRSFGLRAIGVGGMALTAAIAIPADWELPALAQSGFHHEAKVFDKARPGTMMVFPIRPMNLHDMVLVKH